MNQPSALTDDCRSSARRPCSVTTVFGADVPDGSWLTSWIGGLAMQLPAGHGTGCLARRGPGPLFGVLRNCSCDSVDRPGRIVRKSASGLTWDWPMPNRLSSCGGVQPPDNRIQAEELRIYREARVQVGGVSAEAILKIAVLLDIRRRPASQIRGSKRIWIAAAVLVNSAGVGPLSYFAFGRRRQAAGVDSTEPNKG
jgi:hypothetical protein